MRSAFQDGLFIQKPLPPSNINSYNNHFFSLIFTPPVLESGLCKIKAAQQHCQARCREAHLAALKVLGRRGPAKAPLLQALGAHPQTRTVPVQDFEAVALSVGKHKGIRPANYTCPKAGSRGTLLACAVSPVPCSPRFPAGRPLPRAPSNYAGISSAFARACCHAAGVSASNGMSPCTSGRVAR